MLLDVGFEFTVEAADDGDETSLPAETPPLGRDIIKVHRKSNIHKIVKYLHKYVESSHFVKIWMATCCFYFFFLLQVAKKSSLWQCKYQYHR